MTEEVVTITIRRGVLGFSLALLEREADKYGPGFIYWGMVNELRKALGYQSYEEYLAAQDIFAFKTPLTDAKRLKEKMEKF